MSKAIKHLAIRLVAVATIGVATVCMNGCKRKETIIDIETPRGELEVERSVDTGEVDVEINKE